MGTPEFDPAKRKLLFFCRGRGRGHAVPDIEITEQLLRLDNGIDVRFVSYGTGAATLLERGFSVVDLRLPEVNSLLDVIVLSTKVIAWLKPDLVVAHEEFGALPAAKVFDLPAIFITDWFADQDRIIMSALRFADQILFIDRKPVTPEPVQAKGKVTYVGPILRRFEYSRADRGRARRELGLDEDATVVCVLPSGYATEARAPIANLVLEAFDQLDAESKRLLWLAGEDTPTIEALTQNRLDILVIERDWQIDRIMAASDVAITKGTRKTAAELESIGITSIVLSPGSNPIDDARAKARPGVTFRRIGELQPEGLALDLAEAIRRGPLRPPATGRERAAAVVARRIDLALRKPTASA